VAVSVSDSGLGSPPDKPQDIFKPLFTIKESGIGMRRKLEVKSLIELISFAEKWNAANQTDAPGAP
jgi:signal transduction histidine kinase